MVALGDEDLLGGAEQLLAARRAGQPSTAGPRVNALTTPVPRRRWSVQAAASASGGRFCLGIGSSSNVIVERWNQIPFEKPLT